MNLAQAIATRIKELLKETGKTQYKLIKETCLDKSTVQKLMKNKTTDIKLSTVFVIAEFFNMELSEFLNTPYLKRTQILI